MGVSFSILPFRKTWLTFGVRVLSLGDLISSGKTGLPDPSSWEGKVRSRKWAVLRQHRSLPHVLRKGYHLIMGLACFSLYAWGIDRETACWLLAIFGGPFLLLDVLRLQSPWLKKMALSYFGQLMRRNELLGLSGNSFYILGLFVVVFFFPKPIALLSVLYLALGDPVAAFVGTRFGRWKILAGKTLEGALANLTVSALATGWFAIHYLAKGNSETVELALLGGLVSALAELIPFPVDDNFSVPFFSALQLLLLDRWVGLF